MFRFFGGGVSAEIFWLVLVFGQSAGWDKLLVCVWIEVSSGLFGAVPDLEEVHLRGMIQR